MFARFSLSFLIAGAALAQSCPNGSLTKLSPETCTIDSVNYETRKITLSCGKNIDVKPVVTYSGDDRDNSILLVADQVTYYPGTDKCIAVSTLLDPLAKPKATSLGEKFPLTDVLHRIGTSAANPETFDVAFSSLAKLSGELTYDSSTGTCSLTLGKHPEIVCQYYPSRQLLDLLLDRLASFLYGEYDWTQKPCDTSGPGGTPQCLFENESANLHIVINENSNALTMTLKPIYNLSRRR